ncbi:MAG: XRE family transcriptional regulator [Chloroflexota bacterium]|nr:XRE family transcriptional regulator [Chloroflexota bacterium]
MITTEELGRRLRSARERAGYTQDDAAVALGLDATAVTKMERGRRGVGALELDALAALYGVPIDELLRDAGSGVEVELKVVKRVGDAPTPATESMKRRLQRVVSDDRWLCLGDFGPPCIRWVPLDAGSWRYKQSYDRGYQGAAHFREWYGLGDAPIDDLAVLADELGMLVVRLPLGARDAPDGCSGIDPVTGAAYILINSDKSRARRRFTIAHEIAHLALGHLGEGEVVLDKDLAGGEGETEANAFAAGLLMPKEGVEGALKRLERRLAADAGPLDRAVWLAQAFGVSEEAAAYRLKNLGLGTEAVAAVEDARQSPAVLRRVRARLGLAPVNPDFGHGITEVGPAMRARVADALEQGAISPDGAAGMLGVPTSDIYRWAAEWGIRLGAAEAPL